jgi:uncharacterized protein (TIGR02466 family)
MIQQLFPEFYYIYEVTNHESLKDHFLPIAKEKCQEQLMWPCKVFTSRAKNKEIDYELFLKQLHFAVLKMVNDFGAHKELKYNIESVWMNIYNQGCWQEIHHHVSPISNFSYVYFMNLNENDAEFYFVNDKAKNYSASGLNRILSLFSKTHWPDIFSPQVKEGQMIIFPSHLSHGVHMQKQDTNRCTISGNIFLYPEDWKFATH